MESAFRLVKDMPCKPCISNEKYKKENRAYDMIKTMRRGSLRRYTPTDQVGRTLGSVSLSTVKDTWQEWLQDLGRTRGIVRLAAETLQKRVARERWNEKPERLWEQM